MSIRFAVIGINHNHIAGNVVIERTHELIRRHIRSNAKMSHLPPGVDTAVRAP